MILSKELLGRLQKRKLQVKKKKWGIHKGTRRAAAFGASLDFSDFRLYQPGDDVRHIDWNIYGRTKKHYIKRFLDEQELSVAIYLDATSSMRVIDTKWERAKQIAAAFSYIALINDDRLSFIPVTGIRGQKLIRKGAMYGKHVLYEILRLTEEEKTANFTKFFEKNMMKKSQLTIIITDGLEPLEHYEYIFQKLASIHQEVRFIQLLSKEEIIPLYEGDEKLIDSETNAAVNVSIQRTMIEQYEKRLKEHNEQLESACKRYGFFYLFTTDSKDLQTILLHDCTAKGWF
ncbi:DUF58 domain-containing protein [Bacillus aquiflavi]|uniref:DUF58 domain-containing protein n=1 Tax=Bacillus aquiflavi TaxID=2672567 RepID=UPI001CA7C09F|nr:DUF58 domain-containing protein [Bacillus aquiflavi]UAC49382.1 DUF58 domain-containing protein [Bacillus aquiflavi]